MEQLSHAMQQLVDRSFVPGLTHRRQAWLINTPDIAPEPRESAPKNHPLQMPSMTLGIGQRHHRAPRSRQQGPAPETQVMAKRFEVLNEPMQPHRGMPARGKTAAATALIDQQDLLTPKVKRLKHGW
jgi:hypothetical protein